MDPILIRYNYEGHKLDDLGEVRYLVQLSNTVL